jgi:hypothetical protein
MNDWVLKATEFAGGGAYLLPVDMEEPGEGWFSWLNQQAAEAWPLLCDGDSADCQWGYGTNHNPCICYNPDHQVPGEEGLRGRLASQLLQGAARACREDQFGPHQQFLRAVRRK